MDIKEMEENGTIDYYLDLKKYINEFVNNNYPLSQEDLRSILENAPTENVVQRQETHRILNEAMEKVLSNVADRNSQIINEANEGNYTEFSTNDFKQEIFQMKQEMLEKLWEAQHREEMQYGEGEQTTEQENSFEEQTDVVEEQEGQVYPQESENAEAGEQLVEDVVEQSEEIEIRADEISEVNREINQVERDLMQEQQQPQQDMGMSIGE